MDHDKRMNLVHRGGMAEHIMREFQSRIEDQKEKALKKLTLLYRSGTLDHPTLAAGVAAYCAIEDLEASLRGEIKSGNKAASLETHDNSGK